MTDRKLGKMSDSDKCERAREMERQISSNVSSSAR
jgi:hypothetical protein